MNIIFFMMTVHYKNGNKQHLILHTSYANRNSDQYIAYGNGSFNSNASSYFHDPCPYGCKSYNPCPSKQ